MEEWTKRYFQSAKGRAALKRAYDKYRKTTKGRAAKNRMSKKYKAAYPWVRIYFNLKARFRPSRQSGKGIKNLLKPSDLKMMWFRDKASDMEKPSIDRIDPSGNYCIKNCRFRPYADLSTKK